RHRGIPSSEPPMERRQRSARCPRWPRARKSRRRWGDRFGPIARGSLPRISISIATVRSPAPRPNSTTSEPRFPGGKRSTIDAVEGLDYGGPRVLIYDSANTSAGRLVGNGLVAITGNNQNFNVTPANKLTLQADVSWFRTGWMGSHEFQTGVFIQPLMRLST